MAYRPAYLYLFGLLLLAGCAGKPAVQQDITLANTGAQSPVQTTSTRNAVRLSQAEAEPATSAVVVSGSGATTNIVSDPSFEASRTARRVNPGDQTSPIAIPSPVLPPTRLATAVMIDPASPTNAFRLPDQRPRPQMDPWSQQHTTTWRNAVFPDSHSSSHRADQ